MMVSNPAEYEPVVGLSQVTRSDLSIFFTGFQKSVKNGMGSLAF